MSKVVILGVTGSVAAYRAADLARELMRSGCEVRVCLTDAARQFVTPALFEALTGQPCLTSVFEEPVRGRMAHIDWARAASLVLIAPATENCLANLAHGKADDMLTTICVATNAPLAVAPAMNPQMYDSDANRENLRTLVARGVEVIEPATGDVACGENGQGKLASTPVIVERALACLDDSKLLAGKHVLITLGPTEEPIDPVRFLSNRSSGKMGAALAFAAIRMGARVTAIAGPTSEPLPLGANVIRVQTAAQMLAAALEEARNCDLVIGAAAVADYSVELPSEDKIRSGGELTLKLVPTHDVLRTLHEQYPALPLFGFAAELGDSDVDVRDKLARKGLSGIVYNDVSRTDIGFGADDNEGILVLPDGRTFPLAKAPKRQFAAAILKMIAKL